MVSTVSRLNDKSINHGSSAKGANEKKNPQHFIFSLCETIVPRAWSLCHAQIFTWALKSHPTAVHMYIHVCIHVHIIYIYIHRERDTIEVLIKRLIEGVGYDLLYLSDSLLSSRWAAPRCTLEMERKKTPVPAVFPKATSLDSIGFRHWELLHSEM